MFEPESNGFQKRKIQKINPENLKKSRLNFCLHDILESIGYGVVVVDMNGTITIFNRAAEEMTGLVSDEVIGENVDAIFSGIFFHNSHTYLGSLRDVYENNQIEAEIYTKDKTRTYVSLSVSPLINSKKKKIGAVLSLQDITRMKKLEEQSSRTDRLAAMGEMAVKIAHEIRNPLGSIELFTTALMKDLKDAEDLKSLTKHISSGVKSINTIISNLLLFVRPEQQPDFNSINIHENLNDALFFSHHLMDSFQGITIETDFCRESLLVRGDPELLKQMFLNLILNAIQAMPEGGNLTISTRKSRHQHRDVAEIGLMDTGKGMSKENMQKIFDPFFTTKSNGTGLGLVIVHNILKEHGGTIDISSQDGDGTKAILTLPLWDI